MAVCWVFEGTREGRVLDDLNSISDVLREEGAFIWYDVIDPEPSDLALIQEEFGLHPLAIEDAIKAHERPKIEAYGDYWFLVVKGVTQTAKRIDVHEISIFAGSKFIVTVRSTPAYPLEEIQKRWHNQRDGWRVDSGALLYEILDTIVDGYTPVSEFYEAAVEELETDLLGAREPTNRVLLDIFQMRKDVLRFRRAVVPMREVLTPIIRGDINLFEADEIPYYRDVYDHTVHVIEQLDAARDLVQSAIDIQISISTNRQNEVAKQLTIIATIFLPLTFLTGFFGQNFGFMTERINSKAAFWWLGIGLEVFAFLVLLMYFRFKRWF
jgi:magnesium transporter